MWWNKVKRKNLSMDEIQRLASETVEERERQAYERGTRLADRLCQKIARLQFRVNDVGKLSLWLIGDIDGDALRKAIPIMAERGFFALWGGEVFFYVWTFSVSLRESDREFHEALHR